MLIYVVSHQSSHKDVNNYNINMMGNWKRDAHLKAITMAPNTHIQAPAKQALAPLLVIFGKGAFIAPKLLSRSSCRWCLSSWERPALIAALTQPTDKQLNGKTLAVRLASLITAVVLLVLDVMSTTANGVWMAGLNTEMLPKNNTSDFGALTILGTVFR